MRPNPDVVSGNVERIRRSLKYYLKWGAGGDFSVVIKGRNYPGFVENFSYTGSGMILGPENTGKDVRISGRIRRRRGIITNVR